MAGFLDSKERVIDMVLTDVGKSLLLKGDLHFTYWIPFDDEVDYDVPNPTTNDPLQTVQQRTTELTESPLIREATMGYRGIAYTEVDNTNVHRPMYSAPPGVGQNYPLLTVEVSTGSLVVEGQQEKTSKMYVKFNESGEAVIKYVDEGSISFKRSTVSQPIFEASYPLQKNELPTDMGLEGFLVTMYHSSSMKKDELGQDVGGYQEVMHNRDSKSNIVYRNDLNFEIIKP